MDGLLVIALIAWIVLSAVSKKKKRAAAEAAKRAAMAQASSAPDAGAQQAEPVYDAPVARPTAPAPQKQPAFDPFFGGLMEALNELDTKGRVPAPAKAQPVQQKEKAPAQRSAPTARPQQRVHASMADRTMQTTLRHSLEASSITGHAHTESSITGVEPECAPETPRAAAVASAPAPAGGAFMWDVNDALRGLVLSEILGKPKALQR